MHLFAAHAERERCQSVSNPLLHTKQGFYAAGSLFREIFRLTSSVLLLVTSSAWKATALVNHKLNRPLSPRRRQKKSLSLNARMLIVHLSRKKNLHSFGRLPLIATPADKGYLHINGIYYIHFEKISSAPELISKAPVHF